MDGTRPPENLPPVDELLEFAQATAGDSIGVVEVTNGNTFLTRVDGVKTPAKVGDSIFQGDLIETDADGSIGILFSDDSIFSLAEGGQMVIDEMIYDPGTQEGSANFNIASGVFTFVSGQIAKTGLDAMQVETPTATIGIRGTAGAVRIGKDAPDTYTLLAEGADGNLAANGQAADDVLLAQAGGPPVFVGEMLITNGVGSQTLSQVNATTQVSGPFSPPTFPIILPPIAVQQAYAAATTALPQSPVVNNPSSNASNNAGGNQNTNDDDGGDPGPVGPSAEAGNTDAETDIAAQNAAADAFEQALAEGGNVEDAMAAAAGAATETRIEAALEADPNVFGSAAAISSVIDAQLSSSLGGLGTEASDPLDSGTGTGAEEDDTLEDILDEIISESLADAQQATENVLAEMVFDGLLSIGVLTSVQGLFESIEGTELFDFDTDLAERFSESSFNDPDALGGAGALFDDIFQDTFDELFSDVFANTLTTVVNDVEDDIDDFVNDLASDVADSSVTISTANIVGSTFTFVDNQNDIIVNDTGSNTTLYLAGEAQSGDEYRGDSSQTDGLFFSAPGSDVFSHVLRLTDVNSLGFSSLTMGTKVSLQIASAGDMSFAMGSYGNIAIAGTSTDGPDLDQHWTFTGGIDGSNNTLSVTGSGGNDTVTFGSGTTNVIGGVTGVEYIYLNDSHTTIQSSLSGVTFGASGGSALNLDGASGNSISVMSSAVLSTLVGSTGADILTLDGTIDTLTDGGGNDTLIFSGTGGTAKNVTGWETITGGSGSHTLNLGTANDAILLTGALAELTDNGGTDTLTFGDAGGSVSSLIGIETIIGGSGDDQITFSADVSGVFFSGGGSTDQVTLQGTGTNSVSLSSVETVVGGSGDDTVSFTSAVSSTTVDLGSDTSGDILQLGDFTNNVSVINVETVTGGTGNDTITVSGATNNTTIVANAGDDTVTGGAGDDLIQGKSGNDTLVGGDGVDTLQGGGGSDSVSGGNGNDIITGGDGADTLTGGAGKDTFIYNTVTEFGDTITDFTFGSGNDVLDFNITLSGGSNFGFFTSSFNIPDTFGLAVLSPDIANISDSTTVSSALNASNTFTNAANEAMLFLVDDGIDDVALWYWDDSTGSDSNNGVIHADELQQVVLFEDANVGDISGTNQGNINSANFDLS